MWKKNAIALRACGATGGAPSAGAAGPAPAAAASGGCGGWLTAEAAAAGDEHHVGRTELARRATRVGCRAVSGGTVGKAAPSAAEPLAAAANAAAARAAGATEAPAAAAALSDPNRHGLREPSGSAVASAAAACGGAGASGAATAASASSIAHSP